MNKRNSLLILVIMVLVLVSGCSQSSEDNKITIGTVGETARGDITEIAAKKLEEMGYEVEVTSFSDFNSPNTAVQDGSLEYNFYQHTPFLNNYNASNNEEDLVVVGGQGIYSAIYGVFSNSISSLDEIEDGMVCLIANHTSGMSYALEMLEDAGLIKLKEIDVELYTLEDIESNYKNIEFKLMDVSMIIRSLDDADLCAINTEEWIYDGGSMDDALYTYTIEEMQEVIVTRKENLNTEKSKDVYEAFTSPEVKHYMETELGGSVEPTF